MLKHVSYRSSSSLSRSCEYPPSKCSRDTLQGRSSSTLSHSGASSSMRDECIDSYGSCGRNADNVSLASVLSFSSLAVGGNKFCSRTSSTISLNDQSTVPVKIYLRRLRSDMEYKTVSLSLQTTCKELVVLLLNKFRLRHRDPNLFFVLMEVAVRAPSELGGPVKRQLVLDDSARPAELQQCRPKGEANFSIGVRRGGLVRVHDSILMPGSQYKSLMVSYNTTADQLVQLLLSCYNRKDDSRLFCLHETCKDPALDRLIGPEEFPIRVQASWPREDKASFAFVLRRSSHYSLTIKNMLSWRRSLEQSGTDTESDPGDHDTTRASIMSYSSTASNSSTISNASSSSGVSSDSSGTCSSSGVSSTESDSCIDSPQGSPSPKVPASTPSGKAVPEKPNPVGWRPPKPVPRTLFPSNSSTKPSSTTDDEDSGIGIEDEDVTPLSIDEEDLKPGLPSRAFTDEEDLKPGLPSRAFTDEEDLKPGLPSRAFTISYSAIRKSKSKYANVKSLSKSSVDLKSLLSSPSMTQSKSSTDLTLEEESPLAKSTPKHYLRVSDIVSPFRHKFSTPEKKTNECGCKSCFYI